MSKVEFMKSSVPESYSQALQAQNMIFAANYADIIGYTTFAAVGDLLRNIKSLKIIVTNIKCFQIWKVLDI